MGRLRRSKMKPAQLRGRPSNLSRSYASHNIIFSITVRVLIDT
jgi:hypothetical protein